MPFQIAPTNNFKMAIMPSLQAYETTKAAADGHSVIVGLSKASSIQFTHLHNRFL
jgi:hypothetical protein